MAETTAFTCPVCGKSSPNPNDIREGYCGKCHDWTGRPATVGMPPIVNGRDPLPGDLVEVRSYSARMFYLVQQPGSAIRNGIMQTPLRPQDGGPVFYHRSDDLEIIRYAD